MRLNAKLTVVALFAVGVVAWFMRGPAENGASSTESPVHLVASSGPSAATENRDPASRSKAEPESNPKGWSEFRSRNQKPPDFTSYNDKRDYEERRKIFLEKLPQKKLHLNSQTISHFTSLYADSLIRNSSEEVTSNLSDDALQFLPEMIGPYVLQTDNRDDRPFSIQGIDGRRRYPVVVIDPLNGVLAIVNGEIAFHKKVEAGFDYFITKFGLTLVREFKGSLANRGAFMAPVDADLGELVEKLESDPQVDHGFPVELDLTSVYAR